VILCWIFFLALMVIRRGFEPPSASRKFWGALLLIVLAGGAAILIFYWHATGNPFYRITYYHAGSTGDNTYSGASVHLKLLQISIQPFIMLVEDFSFGIMFLFPFLG
jgi:hypothetical protein